MSVYEELYRENVRKTRKQGAHMEKLRGQLTAALAFIKEEYQVQLNGACLKTEEGEPIREDCDPLAEPHIRRIEKLIKNIEKALAT